MSKEPIRLSAATKPRAARARSQVERLVRPLRIRVTKAEMVELKRRKPTKIEDYESIFGASDMRCAQIMSAAHHEIPMEAVVV